MTQKTVRVYTDGACLGNPGPGGYGVRIRYPDGRVKELGGREDSTTNNRMELKAVIEALRFTREEPEVFIVVDSEYVRLGVTQWLKAWKKKGWLTQTNKPVSNQDLWKELDRFLRPCVSMGYTAGHSGDPDNERCDQIAQAFARGREVDLFEGVDRTPFAPLRGKSTRHRGATRKGGKGEGEVVYLSFVRGELRRHATWAECESVVKGQKGALFKKCRTPEEIAATLRKWGISTG